MAFVLKDRVGEQTLTEGTGAIQLGGIPMSGYQSIATAMATGDTSIFCVRDQTGVWNTFIGQWDETEGTLTRSTILDGSSGAGVPVSLSGAAEVWITPGALLSQAVASAFTIVPVPVRVWAGGVTDTGFQVVFDVAASVPSIISTVGLAVSTTADMANIVASAANVAPTVSVGFSATYYTGKFTITGLTADTVYYYAPRVNGVIDSSKIGTLRTAPTAGTAKTFSFVVGSCTNSNYMLGDPYAPVAAMAPAFVVHCGDMDYSDVVVNDPRAQRDRNTRRWRNVSGAQAMLLAAPIVYMPDDHDFASDDNHWDKVVATAATHAQIGSNTRLVVRETTPRYSDWNSAVLSQTWTWGRVRFIMPDLRSQRRYVDGGPTFLGDGTDPPTGYDHLQAVKDAIDQAETDGIKILVFISTSSWVPAVFDSWERYNSAEQTVIADKFRNSGVHVILIAGDAHQCIADDGTNSDKSSTQDGKLPFFVSSGWNWGAPFREITASSWNSADGDVTGEDGNGTAFLKMTVTDTGGHDIHWQADFYGAPLSGSTATLLGTYKDTDATVTVGFATASALRVETGRDATLALQKSWLGPVTGCTVNYTWASGPTGTVTFTPNRNTGSVPRTYTTGVTDTVTISSPVRCSLGAITSRNVEWITLEAETSDWLAQVTTRPSDEIVDALNTFIAGLKSDGLWTQILKLYWLGAHTEQASKIEFKSPGTSTLTVEGSPSYAALQGWRSTNVAGATLNALNTGYAIPAGNQNSLAALVRCIDAVQSFNGEFGAEKYYINPYSTTANDLRTRSASTTSDNYVSTNIVGSFGFSRTGSADYKQFINGAAVATVTRTSTAPDSNTMRFCGFYNATTPTLHQSGARRVAVGMISAGLSDADVLAYYNRETTFLQAVGTL